MSGPERTRVTVISPCRNEGAFIEAFVEAVFSQALPEGAQSELIVADGMSTDGTRALLKKAAARHRGLRVIDNPEGIVSTGLNRAIAAATGSVIIRMDVHTSYADNYVAECVATLRRTGADNVGGPWVARGTGGLSNVIAAAFQSRLVSGGGRAHDLSFEGEVDTVYLGCWPRESFERFGVFDEDLVRNQDDEWNLRARRAGARIWQSPTIVSHYVPRSSLRSLARQYMQYGYWKVRVIQKHRLPASPRHLVPALFVASLLTGPFLALVSRWIALGFAAELLAYVVLVVGTSVRVGLARRVSPSSLTVVFATYHLAYGLGFLRGVVDFLVLRHRGRAAYARLSR